MIQGSPERAADMNKLNARAVFHRYLPSIISGLLFGLSYPSYPYVRLEVLAWVWMAPLLLALKPITAFGPFLRRVGLATLLVCVIGMSWLMTSSAWGGFLLFFVGAFVFMMPFVGFYF